MLSWSHVVMYAHAVIYCVVIVPIGVMYYVMLIFSENDYDTRMDIDMYVRVTIRDRLLMCRTVTEHHAATYQITA